MAHQYIYIVHDNTDEQGWQYRSRWSDGEVKQGDEPWVPSPLASSMVRRRIWMTTVVDRLYLTLSKRLLSDNIRVDNGGYKMQGELLRYEKGTLTKSWQKRRVALASNRLEFYGGSSNSSKKGEIPLNDCEVKMLFESQCPGKNYAFSIRNPMGNVGIVLDAESGDARRSWVLAIQYQLAINSNEFNFPPMEYAPPTGEYPDNRVLLCGDLMLQGRDSEENVLWSPRHFQLLPREIVYYENAVLMGRIFVENAQIEGDSKSLNFQIRSASGITLYLSADTPEAKNLWLLGVNRQIQFIESQKLKLENIPKEELNETNIKPSDKLALYYDDRWTAPPVPGTDDAYLQLVFGAQMSNNPNSVEFTELIPAANTTVRNEFQAQKHKEDNEAEEETFETTGADGSYSTGERKSATMNRKSAEVKGFQEVANVTTEDGRTSLTRTAHTSKTMKQESSSSSSSTTRTVTSSSLPNPPMAMVAPGAVAVPQLPAPPIMNAPSTDSMSVSSNEPVLVLNPRRSLINPKFILTVLKGVTHRFLLSMESETRLVDVKGKTPRSALKDESPVTKFPPRFSVGGPRASKDPRSTPIEELIEITSAKPEIQLPPGWVMMHQYIHIVQPNTDENGWQYRSNWAEGVLSSKDEQWVERYKPGLHNVRRRLWMTTVVKKGDIITAKKLVFDSLNGPNKKEVIMQGNLYRYNQELGQSSTSWQRRKVLLYHHKLEFFIGNERKGEAELEGCTVKMLFGQQCPGRNYAFSLRNASGTVGLLLEGESEESRLRWVKALQYQISLLTPDCNFAPLPYSPPTGVHPSNRILLCGDLRKDGQVVHVQLKYTQLLCFLRDQLHCRLLLDGASMASSREESGDEFAVRFRSGYILHLGADSPEAKLSWVRAIRRQVHRLDHDRQAPTNTPPDELKSDELSPTGRFLRCHDAMWTAPPVDLEAEQEFLDMEQETLVQLSNTEVWDGELKAVTSRPPSSRSVVSQKSNASSGRSSSRSRSRGSRRREDEVNSTTSRTTDRSSRSSTDSTSRGRGRRRSSEPSSPVPSSRGSSSPKGNGQTSMMIPPTAPVAPHAANTTTTKVTTSSSKSSSSSFQQSTSTTTTTGGLGISAGGSSGLPALKVSSTFGKKLQPMTLDSDSD